MAQERGGNRLGIEGAVRHQDGRGLVAAGAVLAVVFAAGAERDGAPAGSAGAGSAARLMATAAQRTARESIGRPPCDSAGTLVNSSPVVIAAATGERIS